MEGGGRLDNYSSDSIRQVIGIKGGWGDAWTYDVYGQLRHHRLHDSEGNFLGTQQINNALDRRSESGDRRCRRRCGGAPVCARHSAGPIRPACPGTSGKKGGVTPAAAHLPDGPGHATTSNSTEYIVGWLGDRRSGQVRRQAADGRTPGIDVNVGTEYRQESFKFNPDYIFANGFQAGGAPAMPINGGFHVWEGFIEMRVPLVERHAGRLPPGLRRRLPLLRATRSGSTPTPTSWVWNGRPIQDIRLRGSYNRAVRAPNLNELYTPAAVGAGGTADPCWGTTPPIHSGAVRQDRRDRLTVRHTCDEPGAQINTKTGGNADLQPEKADTYTCGVVLQPSFLQSFVMSVDY